jgi:group I intron endonuclease
VTNGIYALICLKDQTRYIGGTGRLDLREEEHWRLLSAKKHYNPRLQKDYDLFGASSFAFVVIEWVSDPTMLDERERYHIVNAIHSGKAYNRSVAVRNKQGYKLSSETRRKQSAAKLGKKRPGFGEKVAKLIRKRYRVRSPNGEIIEIKGLKDFCEKHGLNVGCLSNVARGRAKQHKGWTAELIGKESPMITT